MQGEEGARVEVGDVVFFCVTPEEKEERGWKSELEMEEGGKEGGGKRKDNSPAMCRVAQSAWSLRGSWEWEE